MKRLFFGLALCMVIALCSARGTVSVGSVTGDVLHTIQAPWIIADSTTSAGDEPAALSTSERTYKLVNAAIAAASSGNDEISIVTIPAKWNSLRFRALSIDNNTGTATHDLYFGTLGDDDDCELTYAGSLSWTAGDQDSTYHQITFISGSYEPKAGDIATGTESGETANVVSVSALSSGTWAAGTAAGTITYRSKSGTFTNSETISITRAGGIASGNAYTHAASDLVVFELMDTLVLTEKAWGSAWSTVSPADDTLAEAEVDRKNADILVVVTSACTADTKLLMTGY